MSAPSIASKMKWLAVAMITNAISSGYSSHSTLHDRQRTKRASGQPIISANATCIEGTAAYRLMSAVVVPLRRAPSRRARR